MQMFWLQYTTPSKISQSLPLNILKSSLETEEPIQLFNSSIQHATRDRLPELEKMKFSTYLRNLSLSKSSGLLLRKETKSIHQTLPPVRKNKIL